MEPQSQLAYNPNTHSYITKCISKRHPISAEVLDNRKHVCRFKVIYINFYNIKIADNITHVIILNYSLEIEDFT